VGQNVMNDGQFAFEYQPERVVPFGSVTAAYFLATPLFLDGIVSLYLYTEFNAAVKLSLDGVRDWITLPAGPSAFIFDAKSNKAPIPGKFGIYVKNNGVAITSGALYISAMTVV
jgi:hypothetical protein